jgi:hypothetical protein
MAEDRFAEGYAVGRDGNCGYNNGGAFGLGGEWGGIIGLIAVASIFGNGGIFGNNNRGNCATQADVRAAVDQQTLISKIDQQTYGLADSFNSLNNTLNTNFRGIDNAICSLGYNIATQFAGVDKAFCTQGYQTQAGFNTLANQIASCCCDLKQLNLENRYLNEKQTCDIIGAINAGNQRLVDIYTNDKLESLRAENVALKGQISNERQSAYITDTILDKLSPCPKPAYLTCNPNAPYGFGYGFPFNQSNCACGCN